MDVIIKVSLGPIALFNLINAYPLKANSSIKDNGINNNNQKNVNGLFGMAFRSIFKSVNNTTIPNIIIAIATPIRQPTKNFLSVSDCHFKPIWLKDSPSNFKNK